MNVGSEIGKLKLSRLGAAYRLLGQASEALAGDDMPADLRHEIVTLMGLVENEIEQTLVARTKRSLTRH